MHLLASDEECLEPFENIENMTIERFYNDYIKSNGLKKYRHVHLGVWIVDIKLRLKILTDEPGKLLLYRKVIRGTTHKRARP